MQTYTFGQCSILLDIDPKVFRELVEKELGLQKGEQVSRADRRARYLTREQLELLATLLGRTLLDDDVLEQPKHVPVASYKLLLDRMEAAEEALHTSEQTVSSLQDRLTQVEQHIDSMTAWISQLESLPTWMKQVDERLAHSQEQPDHRLAELAAQHRQQLAEVEARYQRQVDELEAQLARYRTDKHPPSTPSTAATKQGKTRSKTKKLPKALASRRAFAALHHIPDSLVARACTSGKIATTSGKWLYKSRVIFQALGTRGRADFYELFHARPDFTQCNQCPHYFTQE